jgi:hypothetical protein
MQDWNSEDPCLPSKNHSLSHKLDGLQSPLEDRSWVTFLKILIEQPVSPLLPPRIENPIPKFVHLPELSSGLGAQICIHLRDFDEAHHREKSTLSKGPGDGLLQQLRTYQE